MEPVSDLYVLFLLWVFARQLFCTTCSLLSLIVPELHLFKCRWHTSVLQVTVIPDTRSAFITAPIVIDNFYGSRFGNLDKFGHAAALFCCVEYYLFANEEFGYDAARARIHNNIQVSLTAL